MAGGGAAAAGPGVSMVPLVKSFENQQSSSTGKAEEQLT